MEKFSQLAYNSITEAGMSRVDILDSINSFYEKQCKLAWKEGMASGVKTSNALVSVVVILVVVAFPVYFMRQDYVAHKRYMDACKMGDPIVCLEGVQDQLRQTKKDPKDAMAYYDRANQLLLAYRLKTGGVLPSK